MDKEDIEKAAAEYANEACRPLWRTGNEQVCMTDFIEGVKWRINSVWHDVKDIPKESSAILAIRPDGSTEIVYFINLLRWRSLIKRCGFVQWAYIKDLIPNKEGEQ